MPTVPYVIASPSGNVTLLAPAAGLDAPTQARIARRLLAQGVGKAEQMGFYTAQPPTLRMAGGEFCLNATRALAALFAADASTDDWLGHIHTSGIEVEARALRLPAAAPLYTAAVTLPVTAPPARSLAPGVVLQRLPGISHILLDARAHPFPTAEHGPGGWRREAADLLARHGLEGEQAVGCVWWRPATARDAADCPTPDAPPDVRIDPVVTVREPFTVFYESACGSGSLALALALGPERPWVVAQPGGESLTITFAHGAPPVRATVSGPVRLLGRGMCHC